ncbi:unnamed protein product [Pleuronectes platessa]|uniref:Uncharacterized protein n=1 Tax=Pleuronectes platessa TaxID=8262 RepID=A0A9N7UQ76_PLEPL|nr:unnamed protein product [Pleuronectes platessa]
MKTQPCGQQGHFVQAEVGKSHWRRTTISAVLHQSGLDGQEASKKPMGSVFAAEFLFIILLASPVSALNHLHILQRVQSSSMASLCVRSDPAFAGALPSGSTCPFGLWVIHSSSMAGLFSLEVCSPEVLPFGRTPRVSCLLDLQPSGHLLEVFCGAPAQCSGYCPEIPSPTFLFPVHWPPSFPSGGMCLQSALYSPFL